MQIKPHPDLAKRFQRIFIRGWILMALLMGFETQNYFGMTVWRVGFVLLWVTGICGFIYLWRLVRRVPCPQCGAMTTPHARHPALPDTHSVYCHHCDILWDTGLGNSD